MKHIWKLTKACKPKSNYFGYNLNHINATSEYYSSLKKVRKVIKDTVESGEISSANNWTNEEWQSDKYCIVINSGGCGIFSFRKIYVK